MNKNCLNCKYEPDWGELYGGNEYARRSGACKWDGEIPVLPSVYQIPRPHHVIKYNDNSGIETNCKTWEKK